jgi:hypothetical protein
MFRSSCAPCSKDTTRGPRLWKRAVISVRNTLQGTLVCHLSGTAELGALEASLGKKWRGFPKRDKDPERPEPPTRLAWLNVLFQRATSGTQTTRTRHPSGGGLTRTASRCPWTRPHNTLSKDPCPPRTDFAQVTPKAGSVELSELSRIFNPHCHFMDQVCLDCWAFRHLTDEEQDEASALLAQLRSWICAVQLSRSF